MGQQIADDLRELMRVAVHLDDVESPVDGGIGWVVPERFQGDGPARM
ncbi:hypothetical protein ACFY6U_50850 [Streptomyces sp. NPDC013157]